MKPKTNLIETAIRGLAEEAPHEMATRLKKNRELKAAGDELVRLAPALNHNAFELVAKRLNVELDGTLRETLSVLKVQWKASYDAAMAHTHEEARKYYRTHQAEIEAAGSQTETLNGLRVQTYEEIQAEFMTKMKSANRQCAVIMGKINSLVAPVRAELADAIERLAWQIEDADQALALELGLQSGPSAVVLQLKNAVVQLRHTAMQLNPNSDAPVSIADFCTFK